MIWFIHRWVWLQSLDRLKPFLFCFHVWIFVFKHLAARWAQNSGLGKCVRIYIYTYHIYVDIYTTVIVWKLYTQKKDHIEHLRFWMAPLSMLNLLKTDSESSKDHLGFLLKPKIFLKVFTKNHITSGNQLHLTSKMLEIGGEVIHHFFTTFSLGKHRNHWGSNWDRTRGRDDGDDASRGGVWRDSWNEIGSFWVFTTRSKRLKKNILDIFLAEELKWICGNSWNPCIDEKKWVFWLGDYRWVQVGFFVHLVSRPWSDVLDLR